MKPKPYIGITGFKIMQDIHETEKIFEKNPLLTGYTAMYGILCSMKRLYNAFSEGKTSPSFANIPMLLDYVPTNSLAMIHYHTKEKETLDQQIKTLFSTENIYHRHVCKAVQLNVDWPGLDKLEKIKTEFLNLQIVLQLPKRATKDFSLKQATKLAGFYDDFVDYVLIDPSGEKGEEFDLDNGVRMMNALYGAMPTTRIGIAGGFSGLNVEERVSYIKDRFPEPFFIDAQGKLRKDGNLYMPYV